MLENVWMALFQRNFFLEWKKSFPVSNFPVSNRGHDDVLVWYLFVVIQVSSNVSTAMSLAISHSNHFLAKSKTVNELICLASMCMVLVPICQIYWQLEVTHLLPRGLGCIAWLPKKPKWQSTFDSQKMLLSFQQPFAQ